MSDYDVHIEGGEKRFEYSEQLWITTGVSGRDQEGSFMNATLQQAGEELEFSVAVHMAVPLEASESEAALHEYLYRVWSEVNHHADQCFGKGTLNVEIQLGPARDDD